MDLKVVMAFFSFWQKVARRNVAGAMALFHAHCHLRNDPIAFDGDNSQVFLDDCNEYLTSSCTSFCLINKP